MISETKFSVEHLLVALGVVVLFCTVGSIVWFNEPESDPDYSAESESALLDADAECLTGSCDTGEDVEPFVSVWTIEEIGEAQTERLERRIRHQYDELGYQREEDEIDEHIRRRLRQKQRRQSRISLPLVATGSYDFTVDWGDGNRDHITAYNQEEVSHAYDEPGSYTVTIDGQLEGWSFGRKRTHSNKIAAIEQWGGFRFGNSGGYFEGAENLEITAGDRPDLSEVMDMSRAFADCYSLERVPSMEDWNMSRVADMSGMLNGASSFNQDIGDWDTSSVTDMSYMFRGANSFDQDIGDWDTSSVTDMSYMFARAYSFDRDIGGWDTSSVRRMAGTFSSADAFDRDLGGWDVSNVTGMWQMFTGHELSTAHYDSLLVNWSEQDVEHGVVLEAGESSPSAEAEQARDALIEQHGWYIADAATTAGEFTECPDVDVSDPNSMRTIGQAVSTRIEAGEETLVEREEEFVRDGQLRVKVELYEEPETGGMPEECFSELVVPTSGRCIFGYIKLDAIPAAAMHHNVRWIGVDRPPIPDE